MHRSHLGAGIVALVSFLAGPAALVLAAAGPAGVGPAAVQAARGRRISYAYGSGRVTLERDTSRAAVLLEAEDGAAAARLADALAAAGGFQSPAAGDAQDYPGLWLPRYRPGLDEGAQRAAVERLHRQPGVSFAAPLLHYHRALVIPRPEVLIAMRPGTADGVRDRVLRETRLELLREFPALDPTVLAAAAVAPLRVFELCDALRERPEVMSAQPNFILKLEPHTTPNDPLFDSQWDLDNTGQFGGTPGADMSAPQAWDLSTGASTITIAILDEGVDVDHPDLAANMVDGHDSVTADPTPAGIPGNARNGDPHGTACAGIAGAVGNNGIGIAGINWNAKIMPVRMGFGSWWTQEDWIIDAITWATDNGADVLSNSWGGGPPSTPEQNAIIYANDTGRAGLGCAVFFSSGNDDGDVSYPAAYPESIAVGATSPCDERKSPSSCDGEWWWGSNFGAELDLVAPGPLVTTTDIAGGPGYSAGDYTSFSGTSSACPHAAGAGALLLAVAPGITHDDVRTLLQDSAADQVGPPAADTPGWDAQMGWGRVDLVALLELGGGGLLPPTALTCDTAGGEASLTWLNPSSYTSIIVSRQGVDVATLAGSATSYVDPAPGLGAVTYGVRGVDAGTESGEAICDLFFAGGATDLVFSPPDAAGAVDGGQAIVDALTNQGRTPILVTDLIGVVGLDSFESIWVNLGIFPDNHALTLAESSLLAPYLTNGVGGSFLYMEGGDAWAFDTQTPTHSLFGIIGLDDGLGDLTIVDGVPGTPGCGLAGLGFDYTGENSWIDHLAPAAGAWTILESATPAYDVGVYRNATLYRTIGTSFEFGGLADGASTKDDLMAAYLACFAVSGIILPVQGLSCSQLGSNVLLTWSNPSPYDAVEVSRDGVLLATLAGDAHSYIDGDPLLGLHTYDVVGISAGTAALPAPCDVLVDLPDNVLRGEQHQGAPGETVDAMLRADFGLDTSGYSFGVEFDPTLLQVEDLLLDGTAAGALGADFFAPNIDNVQGAFSVGVVIDISPPITDLIASGPDQAVLDARLTVAATAAPGAVIPLVLPELTSTTPPVAAVFVQGGGTSFVPQLIDGSITVTDPANLLLSADVVEGLPGELVDHFTRATNEIPLAAFSYGLDYDESVLSLASLDLDGTEPGALGADFFAPQWNDDPGEGWYTVGVVIDLLPPIDTLLPIGVDQPLVHAQFAVSLTATVGTVTPLTLIGTAGSPPVGIVFSAAGGTSMVPDVVDGSLEVVPGGGLFIRGDSNGDGEVVISDPVYTLDYLMSGGAALPCECAGDANDDGSLDIADPIYTLEYLFVFGPEPPAPFPDAGIDPTPDGLTCDAPLIP